MNAAFGRAHITRRISVKPGQTDGVVEDFVLNAGGLRVKAQVGGSDAPQNTVSFSIYSDRDQTDNRKLILSAARPNLVVRLNAGIYHIVSTYGDCNAVCASDVDVEAGKRTEAVVTHSAAKATLKLVHRAGGEALPDTQWTIQTPEGDEIKESVGALPTHILAPGKYACSPSRRAAVPARHHARQRRDDPGRAGDELGEQPTSKAEPAAKYRDPLLLPLPPKSRSAPSRSGSRASASALGLVESRLLLQFKEQRSRDLPVLAGGREIADGRARSSASSRRDLRVDSGSRGMGGKLEA